jgi:hypothetical protein
MPIVTKKEIEAIEYLEINKCKLVAYEDFLALKETLKEAIEVIESNRFQLGGDTGRDIAIDEGALKHNTETSLYLIRELLAKYNKEDYMDNMSNYPPGVNSLLEDDHKGAKQYKLALSEAIDFIVQLKSKYDLLIDEDIEALFEDAFEECIGEIT